MSDSIPIELKKRVVSQCGTRKIPTPKSHIDNNCVIDENGIHVVGRFRGFPAWVSWYALRNATEILDIEQSSYDVTDDEKDAFPQLKDVSKVILKVVDMRDEGKGFRTYVILPEGIKTPNYDLYLKEWNDYVLKMELEEASKKPKRKPA